MKNQISVKELAIFNTNGFDIFINNCSKALLKLEIHTSILYKNKLQNVTKFILFSFFVIYVLVLSSSESAFSEQYDVSIPFGSYDPRLNTPAVVWFDPPEISILVDDTVIWLNDDQEAHTITSGEGTGRFGWTESSESFGNPTGLFDSGRFMPGESWSFTFNEQGTFLYFCVIHPWMEGVVYVDQIIPDYPHDAKGNKLERFPILQITPDQSVEINFSWEPKIIRTNEKVNFIYRFYDAVQDLPLKKIQYDIIIIQNGKEVFRSENAVSGFGGDYRQWVFEESGPIIIKFRNIKLAGSVVAQELSDIVGASSSITLTENSAGRIGEFTAIVYFNPIKTTSPVKIVQPEETAQFYYELPILVVIIPTVLLLIVIFIMKKKPVIQSSGKKSTPI